MSIVVSDTSPVRALGQLGSLPWLEELFERVILPPTVRCELENPPASIPTVAVAAWAFLEVRTPQDAERVLELQTTLDAGESEAIALAEEIGQRLC